MMLFVSRSPYIDRDGTHMVDINGSKYPFVLAKEIYFQLGEYIKLADREGWHKPPKPMKLGGQGGFL